MLHRWQQLSIQRNSYFRFNEISSNSCHVNFTLWKPRYHPLFLLICRDDKSARNQNQVLRCWPTARYALIRMILTSFIKNHSIQSYFLIEIIFILSSMRTKIVNRGYIKIHIIRNDLAKSLFIFEFRLEKYRQKLIW